MICAHIETAIKFKRSLPQLKGLRVPKGHAHFLYDPCVALVRLCNVTMTIIIPPELVLRSGLMEGGGNNESRGHG